MTVFKFPSDAEGGRPGGARQGLWVVFPAGSGSWQGSRLDEDAVARGVARGSLSYGVKGPVVSEITRQSRHGSGML